MSIPEKNRFLVANRLKRKKGRLWYDTIQYYNIVSHVPNFFVRFFFHFKKPEDYMLFVVVF